MLDFIFGIVIGVIVGVVASLLVFCYEAKKHLDKFKK